MQIELVLNFLIGVIIITIGILVYRKQALFLLNFNSWMNLQSNSKLVAKVWGIIICLVGIGVLLLPLILGTDTINPNFWAK